LGFPVHICTKNLIIAPFSYEFASGLLAMISSPKVLPMNHAKSFRDLKVYVLARELAKEVFEASKMFPTEEKYSLTDQVRRSSRSVGSQIAEAWAKRRYVAQFAE
jgi:hypothetical protein